MGDPKDTICALSTAPGRAGIAVVRLSGSQSFPIAQRLFIPSSRQEGFAARTALLGTIVDPRTGAEIDQVLLTQFPEPHSYTGEDVVEVSLHGNPVLVAALLDCICSEGGRLAEPGEFTLRAFLNRRMDLTQAEAVRDVVESTTLFQAQVAARQRSGEIARSLEPLKQSLIELIVQLESAVEFVEDCLEIESREKLARKLESACACLGRFIDSFRQGRIIHDGFSMAIAGRPNVGKSSIFNALLERDRAIVAEMPGTTRDLITESTSMDGIPVRLVDTAGIRDADDYVEKLGVERSFTAIADADAILLVIDASTPLSEEDDILRRRIQGLSCIVVMNKCDLGSVWTTHNRAEYAGEWPALEVSAKSGQGIEDLRRAILRHLFGETGTRHDGTLITNLRQRNCLVRARDKLAKAGAALQAGLSEEFVLFDLHGGLRELGALTGETSVEDILGEVFSRFCVGK